MSESDNLKVAILGTRGVPARYGGFETFAEELGVRLVDRGHSVTVYGRRSFGGSTSLVQEYRGIRVKVVPTLMHKYLETPLHSLLSFLTLFSEKYDVVLLCNAANSPFAWIVKVRGLPLLINVDGIERFRSKWSLVGRAWYRLGEICSVLFASKVIADADVIADYYRDRYRCSSQVIRYGASVVPAPAGKVLERFGLTSNRYLLYVSRLEPENNALGVIEAYVMAKLDMPLVVVGDAPYAKKYIEKLKSAANSQVVFTGYQFGADYRELRANCYLYVQATEVGGTHPALVEAMAYGNCIVANDVPEHREVLGDCGLYYKKNDFNELSAILTKLVAEEKEKEEHGLRAKERAERCFSWEGVCDAYEHLFYQVKSSRRKKRNEL